MKKCINPLGCENEVQEGDNFCSECLERGDINVFAAVGDRELVEALLVEGAEINAIDKFGKTALDYASFEKEKNSEMIRFLKSKGALKGSELQ